MSEKEAASLVERRGWTSLWENTVVRNEGEVRWEEESDVSSFRCWGDAFDLLIHLQDVTEKRLYVHLNASDASTLMKLLRFLLCRTNIIYRLSFLSWSRPRGKGHETRWPDISSSFMLEEQHCSYRICKNHENTNEIKTKENAMEWTEWSVYDWRDVLSGRRSSVSEKGLLRSDDHVKHREGDESDHRVSRLSLFAWLGWQAPINPVLALELLMSANASREMNITVATYNIASSLD